MIDLVDDVAPILGEDVKGFVYRKASVDDQKMLEKAMTELSQELGGFDVVINSVAIVNERDPSRTVSVNIVSLIVYSKRVL